jgi:hypothetical protein
MKITTDVNTAGFRPSANVQPRVNSGAENRIVPSDAVFTNDVIIKMQKERSMIDALTLAQTSRELVQKAINISSRLMSLASEAMRTGHVDMNELSSQISNIQGSMVNYGETFSVPVSSTAPAVQDLNERMNGSFIRLKDTVADMISGRSVPGGTIKAIAADLNQIASEFDSKIQGYSTMIGNVKPAVNAGLDYLELNKNIAVSILKSPEQALISQGNINIDMAGKLTMT